MCGSTHNRRGKHVFVAVRQGSMDGLCSEPTRSQAFSKDLSPLLSVDSHWFGPFLRRLLTWEMELKCALLSLILVALQLLTVEARVISTHRTEDEPGETTLLKHASNETKIARVDSRSLACFHATSKNSEHNEEHF